MAGYKTYILLAAGIGWVVLTGLVDLGLIEETRWSVFAALMAAGGIALRAAVGRNPKGG